ncbi:MAG TPA: hypothetical protein VED67_00485 [Thermodesulfovibrionales bacterium]|nr:hypothetical protein [Thermodesulfovibrionales bacterium]
MYTLYDYLTHVKGVEYIISILFIAGYILYAEVLKPKPFRTLKESGKEDFEFVRNNRGATFSTFKKIVAAPFIGLAYVVSLPFAFLYALGTAAIGGILGLAGRSASFGWRPTEAYLAGKKKKMEEKKQDEKK